MPKLMMDWNEDRPPQRGDVLSFPKTRYWVLAVRKVKRRDPLAGARYQVWCDREQNVDAELRTRLFRSAERRGGSMRIECYWNPRKSKRKTFEQMMSRV
jgi:hypothetical protein